MKLQTDIKPRTEGTVICTQGDETYVFQPSDIGDLVCDVTDEAHLKAMLGGGRFFPADPADFDAALALSETAVVSRDIQPDDDENDDEVINGGLPVEAQTKPNSGKTSKKNK